ncbi:MAG TPA: hypothetical protein VGC67_08730 [Cellulomonas sp.]
MRSLLAREPRTPVGLLAVRVTDIDLLGRARGREVALRAHLAVAEALGATSAGERGAGGDVFVDELGSFVVTLLSCASGTGADLERCAQRAVRAATDGLHRALAAAEVRHPPSLAVRVAYGKAGPDLLARVQAAAAARVDPGRHLFVEPVLSIRSGRVRALHVQASTQRRAARLGAPQVTWVLPQLGAAIRDWSAPVRDAVGVVWVDLDTAALRDEATVALLDSAWPHDGGGPALGVRLHARPELEAPVAQAVIAMLAGHGVRWALAGLGIGEPDPDRLDTRLFHDVVVDPALTGPALDGAPSADAAARATAVVALAQRRAILSTVDGVDDLARLVLAARSGAWFAEGAVFGPVVPLSLAERVVRPGQDVRPPTARVAARSVPAGLGDVHREAGSDEPVLVELVRDWLDDGCTPSRVRVLLNAERRFGRWSAQGAHALVARVAGA